MTPSVANSNGQAADNSNDKKKCHQRIEHATEIDAPVEDVWKILADVGDWEWNKWTRLEAGSLPPEKGTKGKLKACYEGDDSNWQTFDFEFAEVDPKRRVLAWTGSVGPNGCLFRGYHEMRLVEVVPGKTTRLVHTETFGGLLPFLRIGLPYRKLDRNYLLMNESLKSRAEETGLAGA